jgi:hypothetical protein
MVDKKKVAVKDKPAGTRSIDPESRSGFVFKGKYRLLINWPDRSRLFTDDHGSRDLLQHVYIQFSAADPCTAPIPG